MRTIYLTPHPRALFEQVGDHLVITPNSLAAQALGVPTLSLDALGGSALRAARRQTASDVLEERVLRQAIETVLHPHDLNSVYKIMAPLVNELLRVGIDEAKLRRTGSSSCVQLAAVLSLYQSALKEWDVVANSAKLWAAAASAPEPTKLFVIGYPRLGHADVHFLDAVADEGSVLVLPFIPHDLFSENQQAADFLAARGWSIEKTETLPKTMGEQLSARYLDATRPAPEVTAQAYRDREAEVRATLGKIKHLLQSGVDVREIVIIARRESDYGPTLEAIAWEYEVQVNLNYPVALAETRLGAWLDLLTQVVAKGFPYEATARFFKHPLTGGFEPEIWQQARRLLPNDADAWTRLGISSAELQWPAEATRGAFQERLSAVLADCNVADQLADDPQALRVLTLFERELKTLASDESLHLGAFITELRDLLGRFSVPYAHNPSGVALHTPLGVFGGRFSYVFVLGLAEGVLPQAVQDPPLLDFYERRRLSALGLALETAAERANRERISVWALLETVTGELSLSYPQQTGTQANIESAVFSALGSRPVPASTAYCASAEEVRRDRLLDARATTDEVLLASRRSQQIEVRRESESAYDAFDGIVGIPLPLSDYSFSATGLTRIGLCPFRWFAGAVLGLTEPEEAESDLSPRLRGEFYHLVLELAVKAGLDTGGTRAEVLKALSAAFVRAERRLVMSTLPNWRNRRDEHLAFLTRAVQDPEFLPDGTEVVAVEASFETTWKGLTVRGKVDRIDGTADGLSVKDYKTSSVKPKGVKNEQGVAKIDVQLPLYLFAAQTQLVPGAETENMTGHYYSLTRRENRVLGHAKADEDALDALAERVKAHLADGAFPVAPDSDGYACTHCEFDHVCRKGPRINRKSHTYVDR